MRNIDAAKLEEQSGLSTSNVNVNDVLVELSDSYLRLTEVDLLIGDASKAESVLGWKAKTLFNELRDLSLGHVSRCDNSKKAPA